MPAIPRSQLQLCSWLTATQMHMQSVLLQLYVHSFKSKICASDCNTQIPYSHTWTCGHDLCRDKADAEKRAVADRAGAIKDLLAKLGEEIKTRGAEARKALADAK